MSHSRRSRSLGLFFIILFQPDMTDVGTRLRNHAANRTVVRTVELGEGDHMATWELYTEPTETPRLQWGDMDPERIPKGYRPTSPILSTLPHGMPWEGRLIIRHPSIHPAMVVLADHTADGQGQMAVDQDVEWCMETHAVSRTFLGRLEQVRLFPSPEVSAIVELASACEKKDVSGDPSPDAAAPSYCAPPPYQRQSHPCCLL